MVIEINKNFPHIFQSFTYMVNHIVLLTHMLMHTCETIYRLRHVLLLLLFISYVHKLMVQGILRLEWIYKCICVRGKKLGAPGEKVPRTERI